MLSFPLSFHFALSILPSLYFSSPPTDPHGPWARSCIEKVWISSRRPCRGERFSRLGRGVRGWVAVRPSHRQRWCKGLRRAGPGNPPTPPPREPGTWRVGELGRAAGRGAQGGRRRREPSRPLSGEGSWAQGRGMLRLLTYPVPSVRFDMATFR